PRTLVQGLFQVLLHRAQLAFRGDRTDGHAIGGTGGRTVGQTLGLDLDLAQELVIDLGVNVDPLDATTGLTRILEAGPQRAVDRSLQIRVFQHDHRVVTAQLQRQRRQGLRRLRHDELAGTHGTGKEQLVHASGQEARGDLGTAAVDGLEQTCGQAGGAHDFFDQFGDRYRRFRYFQQHRVARHQTHDDFAKGNGQRVVPGADDAHHAHWHVADFIALVDHKPAAPATLFGLQ